MDRPEPLREILCEILTLGLLHIRSLASSSAANAASQIADAADHLHNLPGLIADVSHQELLAYYWEVERPEFRQSLPDRDRPAFEGLWDRLGPLLEGLDSAVPETVA